MKTKSIFQSFLILGSATNTRKQTEKIINPLDIKLNQASPDIQTISPQKSKAGSKDKLGSISINQIRHLTKTIYQKPLSKKFKVTLIENAHKMTHEAQNALLKILEEPPRHAVIILETNDKSGLLPTITSRTTTIQTSQKSANLNQKSVLLNNSNIQKLLTQIAEIDNASSWLDQEISILYNHLLTQIKNGDNKASIKQTQKTIEDCTLAKKMVEANVNPKFVLTNLVFSSNSQ